MILKFLNYKKSIICLIILFSFFPVLSKAANLYLSPSSQDIYKDNSFITEVRLDTQGEEINTAEINIKYPSDLLEIIDVSNGNSIFTLWPEESIIENGKISFTAGTPNGLQTKDGLVAKLIFRAKKIGQGIINFDNNSKILLNDGQGTEAQLSFSQGDYKIMEKPEGLPIISSKTHPDQNEWYQEKTLHLHWKVGEKDEYSYILSYDSLAKPDDIPDKPEGELVWMGDMEYKGLEDGIYYFHLKQILKDGQKISEQDLSISFRAMIDTTPPEKFQPQITEIEGKQYLIFMTKDKLSGIKYYEVQEGDKNFKKVSSPYLLEDQKLRMGIIKVKAVDKAGNQTIEEIELPFKINYGDIFVLLLALITVGIILWILKRRLSFKNI